MNTKTLVYEEKSSAKVSFFSAYVGCFLAAILSITPVLIWLFSQPLTAKFTNFSTIMTSVGQITGLAGMAMMSVAIILSSRPVFFDRLFFGLNNLYKAHKILGITSFLLVLIHPLTLAASYLPFSKNSAAQFLLPSGNLARDFGIYALVGMMALMLITIFSKMRYRFLKLFHRMFGIVFVLAALHTILIPSDVSRNLYMHYYMQGLMALGLTAFTYKTIFGFFLVKRYKYVVEKVQSTADDVVEITLSPTKKPMEYNPGQFVFVSFIDPNISSEPHPFSIASAPNDPELKILVKALGDYTSKLSEKMTAGVKAKIEGPFGSLIYSTVRNKKQIWIAGGSGIAPFIGMARDIKNNARGYWVDLYCCVNSREELACANELFKISPRSGIFRFIPFCKNEVGYINAEKIKRMSGDLEVRDIFLCGPPSMVKSLKEQFAQMRISQSRIHSEEFRLL